MARKLVSFDPDAPSGSKLPSAVQTELGATYAPLWKPSTAYPAGTPALLPDGTTGTRTTTGTSRPAFDSTEEAAWTVAAGGLDETAVAAAIANPETASNSAVVDIAQALLPVGIGGLVDASADLAAPRPAVSGRVLWVLPVGTEKPVHEATGDLYLRGTEVVIAWTPAQLANLHLWLDAQSISGVAADAVVAQWNDLSGLAHHAKQATVANQPLYRTAGLNGHPCLEFDGVNDIFLTDAFTPSVGEAWTDYVVAQSTVATTTGSDFIVGALSNVNAAQRLDMFRTTTNTLNITRGTALVGPALDNGAHRLRAVYNGASSLAQVDAGTPVTGTTSLSGINVARHAIGGRGDLANFFVGKIAEVVRVKGTVSADDNTKMVNYLQTKWGVA